MIEIPKYLLPEVPPKCKECSKIYKNWLADHDKQIRDNTINELMNMLKNEWTIDSILRANDKHRLIAIFKRIADQMKG